MIPLQSICDRSERFGEVMEANCSGVNSTRMSRLISVRPMNMGDSRNPSAVTRSSGTSAGEIQLASMGQTGKSRMRLWEVGSMEHVRMPERDRHSIGFDGSTMSVKIHTVCGGYGLGGDSSSTHTCFDQGVSGCQSCMSTEINFTTWSKPPDFICVLTRKVVLKKKLF